MREAQAANVNVTYLDITPCTHEQLSSLDHFGIKNFNGDCDGRQRHWFRWEEGALELVFLPVLSELTSTRQNDTNARCRLWYASLLTYNGLRDGQFDDELRVAIGLTQ